jgi:hypothetical protein
VTASVPLLVKIDSGNYVPFNVKTLAINQMDMLKALKADDAFSTHLKDVALDLCSVAALTTTKGTKPTPEEEQAAVLLELDTTLSNLVGARTAGAPRFIHVRTSKAAANATSG